MRKWMLTSPFTGETHAVTTEEARRLLGWPTGHDLEAELEAAEAGAAAAGSDRPVRSSPSLGLEEWMVSAPPRRGL